MEIYTAVAEWWGNTPVENERKKIVIGKRDGGITVNGREAIMEFNGIQLRFEMNKDNPYADVYVITDSLSSSQPAPIAEMYKVISETE